MAVLNIFFPKDYTGIVYCSSTQFVMLIWIYTVVSDLDLGYFSQCVCLINEST